MATKGGMIVPVILSGGSGSRLWPLSRKALPKQLLPLAGTDTMIQATVGRARDKSFAPPIIIAGQDHRFIIAEQLRAAGVADARIILEPAGRNTAPAAAVAALKVLEDDPEGLILLMPSDHVVGNPRAFQNAVAKAAAAARTGALVTFGITPAAPETGYGYIKAGKPLEGASGALEVERFVEKPDRATAETYLKSGAYYWNSGMFLFSAKAFLSEMEKLEPSMLVSCRDAITHAHRDLDFIRLGEAAFLACPSQSIDYAIMERTAHAAVVPAEMDWSDVGSWQSLWEISPRDGDGNTILGDVVTQKAVNSYIRSEGPLVAAVGVDVILRQAGESRHRHPHADRAGGEIHVVLILGARRVRLCPTKVTEVLQPVAGLVAQQVLDGMKHRAGMRFNRHPILGAQNMEIQGGHQRHHRRR